MLEQSIREVRKIMQGAVAHSMHEHTTIKLKRRLKVILVLGQTLSEKYLPI